MKLHRALTDDLYRTRRSPSPSDPQTSSPPEVCAVSVMVLIACRHTDMDSTQLSPMRSEPLSARGAWTR